MEEEKDLVLSEGTENVEETTEQTEVAEQVAEPVIEQVTEPTEEKFTKEQVDEIISKRLARKEAKIRKDYEKKYGRVENVVKAGLGVDSFEEGVNQLADFYTNKGINIPTEPTYSNRDVELLAKAEAEDIISTGLDEVIEEVDRLANIGADKMTPRERATFQILAEHRQSAERKKELAKIGVKEDLYNSEGFKAFASQFNSNTPIKTVYELYAKSQVKPTTEPLGSLKGTNVKEEKTYYTSDEVDRLTSKELDDPKVMERVRQSMMNW